jgi:NAD(P)-dependent dehydrogenase (short-subunit alcohol dehydrogenase family)
MQHLRDRTAVITGAASGIGRALALHLAREGMRLALVDRDGDGLDETIRLVGEQGSAQPAGRVSRHVLDVSDKAAMLALPDQVVAQHGGVHLVVANAGVTATHAFHEHSLEDFEWVMGVNLWGVVYAAKAFLPHLLAAEEGHLVTISSIFGIVGIPSQTSYCASKFAVRGFTEALAEELAGSHVGVTVVHPGGINTGIAANSRASDEKTRANMIKFFERHTLPASEAAAQIVTGVRRKRPRVLITKEAVLGDLFKRLLPTRGNRRFVKTLMKVMRMGDALKEAQDQAISEARASR